MICTDALSQNILQRVIVSQKPHDSYCCIITQYTSASYSIAQTALFVLLHYHRIYFAVLQHDTNCMFRTIVITSHKLLDSSGMCATGAEVSFCLTHVTREDFVSLRFRYCLLISSMKRYLKRQSLLLEKK